MATVPLARMPGLKTRTLTGDEPELMEQPGLPPRVLGDTLNDLARINRWLGGVRLTTWGVGQVTRHIHRPAELTVLDIAAGGADIPFALRQWGATVGLRVSIVASDVSAEIIARVPLERRQAFPFVAADALHLPFADGAFDVVTSSLALHHFDPDAAVGVLAEMRRVSRLGIVVNDLVRSWHGYVGAWLVGHLLTRNPLTRHDSTLSVKRAYTRDELATLARQAGLSGVRFSGFLGYRVAMVSEARP